MSGCAGIGSYGSCATEEETGVSYTYGTPSGRGDLPATTCWGILTCPATTSPAFDFSSGGGSYGNPSGSTLVWCPEVGAGVGTWNVYDGSTDTGLASMSCNT